jgi:hypothetical protein
MARADQNNLRRSRIEMDRQQRQDEVEVPGATGSADDDSPKTERTKAMKRRGKTESIPAGIRRWVDPGAEQDAHWGRYR